MKQNLFNMAELIIQHELVVFEQIELNHEIIFKQLKNEFRI